MRRGCRFNSGTYAQSASTKDKYLKNNAIKGRINVLTRTAASDPAAFPGCQKLHAGERFFPVKGQTSDASR